MSFWGASSGFSGNTGESGYVPLCDLGDLTGWSTMPCVRQ